MLANCENTEFSSKFLGRFPVKWVIFIINLCGSKFSCGHANGALVNSVLLRFLNRERQTWELCGCRRIAVEPVEFDIAKSFEISGSWDFPAEFSLLPCTPFRTEQVSCGYEVLGSQSCCCFLWLHLREFSLDISIKTIKRRLSFWLPRGKVSEAGLGLCLTGGPSSWPKGHCCWGIRGDVVPLMCKILLILMKGAVLRTKSNLPNWIKLVQCSKWWKHS